MKYYEGFFILPPDATTEARKTQVSGAEGLVQKFGGKVIQRQEVGRRFLGYPVKKFKEGYMMTLDFEMDPASQIAFRNALELHEDILKFMITIKTKKQEAAASAAAAKPPVAARPFVRKPAPAITAPKAPVT